MFITLVPHNKMFLAMIRIRSLHPRSREQGFASTFARPSYANLTTNDTGIFCQPAMQTAFGRFLRHIENIFRSKSQFNFVVVLEDFWHNH